jgi:hypothetical protein
MALTVALLCGCGAEMQAADAGDVAMLPDVWWGDAPVPECTPGCSSVQMCCTSSVAGNRCVDHFSDPSNCGGCGIVCRATELCINQACRVPGTLDAGPVDAYVRQPDAPIIGSCSPACGADFQCCGSTCVNRDGAGGTSDSSFANCGACGRTCDADTANRCGRFGTMTRCMCGDGPSCEAGARCQLDSDGTLVCM